MSDVETHKGKLVPVVLSGITLEERAECACKKFGFEKASYHESWLDCLKDEGYRAIYVDDESEVIYEIQDK